MNEDDYTYQDYIHDVLTEWTQSQALDCCKSCIKFTHIIDCDDILPGCTLSEMYPDSRRLCPLVMEGNEALTENEFLVFETIEAYLELKNRLPEIHELIDCCLCDDIQPLDTIQLLNNLYMKGYLFRNQINKKCS